MAIRGLAVIFAILLGSRFAYPAPQLPCASAAQYRDLLAQVEQRSGQPDVSLAALADALPAQCDFSLAGQTFHLSNFQMQRELREIAAQPDRQTSRVTRLKAFQDGLRRQLGGIDAYERGANPTARQKLREIMRQREFRQVGSQDPRAYLQEWVFLFLEKFLSRVFKGPVPRRPGSKDCRLVSLHCRRRIRRLGDFPLGLAKASARSRPPGDPFAPSARNWRNWLAEARAAAARGELREAVMLLIGPASLQLESSGAWRPDRARTPREYLRLIAPANPAHPLLAGITREFEVIWYGNRVPAFSEWGAFLAKVERIGCR